MDLMYLVRYMTLLFYLHFTLMAESNARPLTDLDDFISRPLDIERSFEDDYFSVYQTHAVAPKTSLLSRLRRGYYFIDGGKIIPIDPINLSPNVQTARRRLDSFSNERTTNSKPKKLFVPNLFG